MELLHENIGTKIEIEKNLAINAKKLIEEVGFGDKKIAFISDDRILRACGGYFEDGFINSCHKKIILDEPVPDEENLAAILDKIDDCDAIIGLGSGVISDLCKYSSHKSGVPYILFASAPSMNGYLSQNASLIIDGYRKSLAATLPVAIFCDLGILKNAPQEMIKAGIGDSMCFYSCWFDWILSHLLLGTEFKAQCFTILYEKMSHLIQNYRDFCLDDEEFLKLLIEILLLSGASMTIAGNSNPASQSEHLIGHVFAMKYPKKKILHGILIATTCLTSTKIQEEFLSLDAFQMRDTNFPRAKMVEFFGHEIARSCEEEYAKKAAKIHSSQKTLAQDLGQDWPQYQESLAKIILPEQNLRDIFKHFEIETGVDVLGISWEQYFEIVGLARFLRDRFTVLDL